MTGGKQRFGKRVTEQAIIGERGINLIQKIVLDMGCAWHPTNQSLEAGIDGEIELVVPTTREATNTVIRVQSRATLRRFPAETEISFDYVCEERELAYWLSGNAPVVLVVSRPHTAEAYWVSIKDYFSNAVVRKERKVRFDKQTMRFTKDSLEALFRIGMSRSRGIYFAPVPKTETLYTNLLLVSRIPQRLWHADTEVRHASEVFTPLKDAGIHNPIFALKNKRILTVYDLSEEPWRRLVDPGTVEEFEASDWADSADQSKRRAFVELLNRCLTARARQIGVLRRRDDDALFFAGTDDGSSRKVPFRSVKEEAQRTVFQGYPYTKGDRIGQIAYFRHSACLTQFRKYGDVWYLEITPTYHFTSDGRRRHPLSDDLLTGIKRREKQGAVLYQLVMWASMLRGGNDLRSEDVTPGLPCVSFGELQSLTLEVGIDDKTWLPNEDKETEAAGEETLGELPLFDIKAASLESPIISNED